MGKGIFLSVDYAFLQCRVEFAHGHWRGAGTESLHHFNVDGLLHNPHFETLHIFGCLDGALVVGHVAHAIFPNGKGYHAPAFAFFAKIHAHGIQRLVGMRNVPEYKGQVKNGHFGNKIAQHCCTRQGHVHRAKGESFHQISLVAKLA